MKRQMFMTLKHKDMVICQKCGKPKHHHLRNHEIGDDGEDVEDEVDEDEDDDDDYEDDDLDDDDIEDNQEPLDIPDLFESQDDRLGSLRGHLKSNLQPPLELPTWDYSPTKQKQKQQISSNADYDSNTLTNPAWD